MSSLTLVLVSLGYLAFLFAMAQLVEQKMGLQQRINNSATVYALSLTVYCTAWTFYGSIGRASASGIDFLAIYLGPCLMLPLWWLLVRKMVRVSKTHHLSSLADFIAARYGKRGGIGTLVAAVLLVGIVPYIALQIKAIAESFMFLTQSQPAEKNQWFQDPGLYAAVFLTLFTILYGARYLEANRPKPGMISVVAFEGLFKLAAFVAAGIFVVFVMYRGPEALFTEAHLLPDFSQLMTLDGRAAFSDWFWLLLVSGMAVILLPRQFQVAVVENRNEQHLKRAMWLFPLYLLAINLFVMPIALAGKMHPEVAQNPEYAILGLSLDGGPLLATFVYLGGFSAAISMIVISTLAMGNMLSNNILLPVLLKQDAQEPLHNRILWLRRWAIVIILLLAYLYYWFFTENAPLVSIGILSFIAVAQLAPALLGGLYWKRATHAGAFAGIFGGIAIWAYLLIWPGVSGVMGWDFSTTLFAFEDLSPISTAIFLSLMVNLLLFLGVSAFTQPTSQEQTQGELFVEVYKYSRLYGNSELAAGTASFPTIRSLLIKFLGDQRTEEVLDRYARIHQIDWKANPRVDSRVIAFAERLLTEAIGPASARIMIASVAQEEDISMQEVVDILKESQQVIGLNKQLKSQSDELQKLTTDLQAANERLREVSAIKDDFLYTVTHELRTPLTSIRAQAEILLDTEDITPEERQYFLQTIVKDCERLTRLITDVLDLERFESGNQKMQLTSENLAEIVAEALNSTENLMKSKQIVLVRDIAQNLPPTVLDRDRIVQVVVNLLSNAIKFCNQEAGEIRVVAYQLDRVLKVSVIDNGDGIEEEKVARVFEKFYQAHNQLRKKPAGSGLGLAICKNIIQHHCGRIYVKREGKAGTRFTFELPIYHNVAHFIQNYESTLQKDFNRG